MLYEHLTAYFQPWFKADVEAILAEPDIAAVRAGKYVSMHIRRTDKQLFDGDPLTETEVGAHVQRASLFRHVSSCRFLRISCGSIRSKRAFGGAVLSFSPRVHTFMTGSLAGYSAVTKIPKYLLPFQRVRSFDQVRFEGLARRRRAKAEMVFALSRLRL